MSEVTPSNSSAARPFASVRWTTGAADAVAAVRSRPKPLLSCHRSRRAPSAGGSEFASNQSCMFAVTGGLAATAPPTTVIGLDGAALEPALFDAVTTTRRSPPTSPEATTYVEEMAPGRSAQVPPALEHRCHW